MKSATKQAGNLVIRELQHLVGVINFRNKSRKQEKLPPSPRTLSRTKSYSSSRTPSRTRHRNNPRTLSRSKQKPNKNNELLASYPKSQGDRMHVNTELQASYPKSQIAGKPVNTGGSGFVP